jgi:hypothetical protein
MPINNFLWLKSAKAGIYNLLEWLGNNYWPLVPPVLRYRFVVVTLKK